MELGDGRYLFIHDNFDCSVFQLVSILFFFSFFFIFVASKKEKLILTCLFELFHKRDSKLENLKSNCNFVPKDDNKYSVGIRVETL